MTGEKCLPARIRLPGSGPQAWEIPGHRAFGAVEAELQQVTLYLWRSPVVILEPHLSNETSTLFGDPRSVAPLPGSPAPIRVGSLSMPHDYGRWLHDRQNIRPSRPHAPQHDPKEPLEATRHRSWTSPLQPATCWRSASTSSETFRRLRKTTARAARIAPSVSITNQL